VRKFTELLAFIILIAGFASADAIVYDNDFGGVISGDNASVDGYPIFNSIRISNSFVLSSGTSLTGVNLLVEEASGFPVSSLNWSILDNGNPTDPFSGESGVNTLASGAVTATNIFVKTFPLAGVDVDELTFSISTPTLAAGTTYWLQIDTGSNQISVYWDQSDGPSTAYRPDVDLSGMVPCNGLCTDSESFQLLASESPAPEPSSLGLLAGGLAGLIAFRRRLYRSDRREVQ
jgi:hypothetical protein